MKGCDCEPFAGVDEIQRLTVQKGAFSGPRNDMRPRVFVLPKARKADGGLSSLRSSTRDELSLAAPKSERVYPSRWARLKSKLEIDGVAAPQVAGGTIDWIVIIGVCFRVVFERTLSRFWVSAAFPRRVLTDLLHRLRHMRLQRLAHRVRRGQRWSDRSSAPSQSPGLDALIHGLRTTPGAFRR
ncbi:hypothetical protein MPC4_110028 [Methylocella tundrae]|uniref:Uncharacterized protein n=1 Tax=Methylocella tundrae TaxID=227605 RepID=A0A8B6M1L9_METTU|nr:hypothetical protein MPC1_4580002 [Methylocella tundrae]VTZ48728.1 hypothetical protein MPC4_110028 [Methylocella tundrae]